MKKIILVAIVVTLTVGCSIQRRADKAEAKLQKELLISSKWLDENMNRVFITPEEKAWAKKEVNKRLNKLNRAHNRYRRLKAKQLL